MSVKIYTSSSVETLAKEFGQLYISNSNIFNPMPVVVGTNTAKDWLKEFIAKDKGIVGNLSFKNSNDCIVSISKLFGVNESTSDLIQPIQLNWLIYSVFGSAEFQKDFPDIATYFKDNDLKRFTLAEKVAALYDKYQNLKPSIISSWNNAVYLPEKKDEIWQCFVWREVIKMTARGISDLSKTIDRITAALCDETQIALLKLKMPSITFFGQIEYSEELLELLKVLANHIVVSIFRVDFTLEEHKESPNRLIQNFGKFTTTQNELFAKLGIETICLNNTIDFKTNLLGALKKGIIEKEQVINKQIDDSITINNCFSINREVEVLYHYLIKQFEQDPTLGARDICVMTPHPEEYAAAIAAFFTSSDYEIKYTIYDTNINIEESPYAALLAVLALDQDDFTSEEVLKLLDYTYLRSKFDFSEDLSAVRRAIQMANIRHGFDGKTELETNYVSWHYGLKRLMYGICIKNDGGLIQIDGEHFYPVNQFEGEDANDIIRLNYFVEQLITFITKRNSAKTLMEWVAFTEQNAEIFLNTTQYDLTYFFLKLGKMGEVNCFLNEELIPFSVFKYHLESVLRGMESGSKTGFSGVRFTSLQPFLTAPAKIIAFLGMNNADFPRKQPRLSFDLASNVRTTADLDKQLFLNSLLVADNKIYISYVGQSVKDNSSIPPSTVVDELQAAIEPMLYPDNTIESLITKHPLHGFSSLYNKNSKLYRYFKESKRLNMDIENTPNPETEAFSNEIKISDLYYFLADPMKWYYNKILGIYYNEDDAILPETELFALNNLEKWIIKDEVLSLTDFEESQLESFRIEKVKKGKLPLSHTGECLLLNTYKDMEQLKILFGEITSGVSETVELKDLTIGKYHLIGQIDSVYYNRFAFGTVSKDKYKYRLKALIQYLTLIAFGKDTMQLCYVHMESDSVKVVSGITIEEAKAILEQWCGYFEMGQKKMLAFTLDFTRLEGLIERHKIGENVIDELNKKIDAIRNPSFTECYLSDYQKKEIDTNFFEDEDNALEFLEIYEDIIGKLNTYFN
jgi:exodeoxyribonuclease V gamma subunit